MDDQQFPTEGDCLPLPGPHRHSGTDAAAVVPMKLIMYPHGVTVDVAKPDTLVGRTSGVDLRLPLADVSRQHCRFICKDQRWQVVDLNSLNGVYVNDERVSHAVLRHRDIIRIGGFVFEVDLAVNEATLPTPMTQDERVLRSIAHVLKPKEEESKRQAS